MCPLWLLCMAQEGYTGPEPATMTFKPSGIQVMKGSPISFNVGKSFSITKIASS